MMDGIEAAFGKIVRTAERNQTHDVSDYINPADGLLYCGKCHTPKQCRVILPDLNGREGRQFTPPVLCQCEKAERESEEQKRREQLQAMEDAETIRRLKSSSLMDEKFKDQTFRSFRIREDNPRILKICHRYVDAFEEMVAKNQGMLFYGNEGTGKSFAAACIANALLEKRVPVIMTSFVKLLDSMQGFKNDGGEVITQLSRAKLLIIDDLGAERNTTFALEKIYDIIDSRYRSKLPIILTTNLSVEEMKETTDIRYARIYDRVFEMCYPLKFTGKSWRKAEASRRFKEFESLLEGKDGG